MSKQKLTKYFVPFFLIFSVIGLFISDSLSHAQDRTYHEVQYLGQGATYMVDWNQQTGIIAIRSSTGIRLYTDTFEELHHFDIGSSEAIAWSPDGTMLAGVQEREYIAIWETDTYELITQYHPHADTILALAWSPDNQYIASGSIDETVVIWNLENQTVEHIFDDHLNGTSAVAWNADGSLIATSEGGRDFPFHDNLNWETRIWDAETGELLVSPPRLTISYSLEWHPTDPRLLAIGTHLGELNYWDLDNRSSMSLSEIVFTNPAYDLEWSPNGTYLTGTDHLHITTLEAIDKSSIGYEPTHLVSRSNQHEAITHSLSWSSDNQRVVSIGLDQIVRIWDVFANEELATLDTYTRPIDAITWHSNDSGIISAVGNTTMSWDVESGHQIGQNEIIPDTPFRFVEVRSLAWIPETEAVILVTNGQILIKELDRNIFIPFIETDDLNMGHFLWNTEQQQFVTTDWDDTVTIWDAPTQEPLQSFEINYRLASIDWLPSHHLLVTFPLYEQNITLWDTQTGNVINSFEAHTEQITIVKISPNGQFLASGARDDVVMIWDIATGEVIQTLDNFTGNITALDWHPNQLLLAIGDSSGLVSIWDSDANITDQLPHNHRYGISALKWNSDGSQLATASFDGTIRIWEQ